jgi:hypothetical protein
MVEILLKYLNYDILDDIFFKKNIKTKSYYIDPCQQLLTYETHDLG